jgi:hypothetical protein
MNAQAEQMKEYVGELFSLVAGRGCGHGNGSERAEKKRGGGLVKNPPLMKKEKREPF